MLIEMSLLIKCFLVSHKVTHFKAAKKNKTILFSLNDEEIISGLLMLDFQPSISFRNCI